MMANPTAASAAAVAMTKNAAACPARKLPIGGFGTSGKRENARNVRLTALSISSMLISTMIALRRRTTPAAPRANSSAARTR